MLIEIHMIQNHSPANLNRDDLGAPKTCIFGGVTRARISSQCLKRSIRRSADFQTAMERDGGVRTRRLISILAEKAHDSAPPREIVDFVAEAFNQGGVKRAPTRDDPDATNILMFIPQSTIEKMAGKVREHWNPKEGKACNLTKDLAECLGERAKVPDIALCGRMTELDSEGLFRQIDFHVEAALSAAHAISTHEVVNEVDYFTAVDDCAKGAGAGHVNEGMYASACFYKYFCIDWSQLLENLDNDGTLAQLTLRQFMLAVAMSTPSGKQHSFAAFNPPSGILVEIKADRRTPISYANAFADPVPLRAQRGLIGESVARLGQYVHEMSKGYGIEAKRFWFSPAMRYPLNWVDSNAKPEQEKPVVEEQDHNVRSLDDLVKCVVAKVTRLQSSDVRNVGAGDRKEV
jgi:CRISPR system Cascade subunit CasC